MTIFEIMAVLIGQMIDFMKSFTMIYGISLWHIFLLFNVLIDLNLLTRAVFKDRSAKK